MGRSSYSTSNINLRAACAAGFILCDDDCHLVADKTHDVGAGLGDPGRTAREVGYL